MSLFEMNKQEVAYHYGSQLYGAYLQAAYYWTKLIALQWVPPSVSTFDSEGNDYLKWPVVN